MVKFILKAILLVGVSILIGYSDIYAQNIISGKVFDADTKESLLGANIKVKGTAEGTSADEEGKFSLEVGNRDSVVIEVTYVGYDTREFTLKKPFVPLSVSLSTAVITGNEVVVSASRVSESIIQAPVQIQKFGVKEIRQAASGDFYQSLGNLQGVDIVTSSVGFKTINLRGFNTTQPVRMVQFVDGMDNQAPGLSFPVGNLVGATDLDLASVEVISGASSALYGANALQGVVSMTTKNPYDYEGVSVQVKGGSRNYLDIQGRYAQSFGPKEKLAIKLTGGYLTIQDWEASDSAANTYGDIEVDVDMTEVLIEASRTEEDPETRDDLIALTTGYLDFNQNANPGIITVNTPGYDEEDLADYDSRSIKAAASLHYKIKPTLEASYTYKYGLGTAIYQGTNRYSINDIRFQQHKLQLTGKDFQVKAYTTLEDAGDSYDIVFTGIGVARENVPDWVSNWLGVYVDSLDKFTNGFDRDAKNWMVDSARASASRYADEVSWYPAGGKTFDSLRAIITDNPDLEEGSKFLDKSSLFHLDAQYQFNFLTEKNKKNPDILIGASFREYFPRSFGTIFRDTLLNPADTLDNGQNDPDAEYVKLRNWEVGGFIQASKTIFQDRVKLIASIRGDKNQNFDVQISPRGTILFNLTPDKKHVFRISGQSAFRSPTLQNQFILLNLGPITLRGNLNGYDNLYTLNSVDEYRDYYDTTYQIRSELLETITLDPLKLEQVRTIEGGYRGIIKNKLYVDIAGFHNWYKNFIGEVRVARPDGGAQAGEETGEDAILTGAYELYQIPTNSSQVVRTFGFDIGLAYSLGRGMTVRTNYSYIDIKLKDADDDIIPGWNTPKHKVNIGILGTKVWKGLGFSVNWKWVDDYFWQSSFGDGPVESYNILDAQLSYAIEKWYTTLSVGGSNITNQKYQTNYGGPQIGAIVYGSLLFEFDKLK